MILNLLVLAFVLAMAVMWATYGLFSALIHLVVVVVAGALAFAFWELWVYKLLMGTMPYYAWSVGLLGPFVIWLIALRVAADKLIKGNVQVPRLADQIGGGACGAASGTLTAGVAVIGLGFLPLGPSLAGYQPYEVVSTGEVAPRAGSSLWVPVESVTASFFSRLSAGAFSTSTPLAFYMPDLPEQVASFRLARHYDINQSLVASPSTVGVGDLWVLSEPNVTGVDATAAAFLDAQLSLGRQLTVVETFWKLAQGTATYDTDSILRVPPTQVRLAVDPDPSQPGPLELLPPVAFSKEPPGNAALYPITGNTAQPYASALTTEASVRWAFAVPDRARPVFIELRHTRLALPEPIPVDAARMGQLLGSLPAAEGEGEGEAAPEPRVNISADGKAITEPPSQYSKHEAVYIAPTSDLPAGVSKNKAQGFDYEPEGGGIRGGSGVLGKGSGRGDNNLSRILVSESLRPVRLQVRPVQLSSFVGEASRGSVANIQEIFLTDTNGEAYYPFAWVLFKADGTQKVNIETVMFRNNEQLPLSEFDAGDELYIYFRLPPNIVIDRYHIGPATQPIGFEVK